MSDRKRISLSFGDSPDEEFAYNLLQTKGRKKAEYVARCIAAYEKKKNTALNSSSLEIIKTLLEQLVAAAVPAGQPLPRPELSAPPPSVLPAPSSTAPVSSEPDSKSGYPASFGSDIAVNLDPELTSQALEALNAFDAF